MGGWSVSNILSFLLAFFFFLGSVLLLSFVGKSLLSGGFGGQQFQSLLAAILAVNNFGFVSCHFFLFFLFLAFFTGRSSNFGGELS